MNRYDIMLEKLIKTALCVRDKTNWHDMSDVNNFCDCVGFGNGMFIEVTTDISYPFSGERDGFIWFKLFNENKEGYIDEQDSLGNEYEEIETAARYILSNNSLYLGIE